MRKLFLWWTFGIRLSDCASRSRDETSTWTLFRLFLGDDGVEQLHFIAHGCGRRKWNTWKYKVKSLLMIWTSCNRAGRILYVRSLKSPRFCFVLALKFLEDISLWKWTNNTILVWINQLIKFFLQILLKSCEDICMKVDSTLYRFFSFPCFKQQN